MKHLKNRISLAACTLTLTACGGMKSAEHLAVSAVQQLGCKTAQSEMWDSLHRLVEDKMAFPSSEELRTALLDQGKTRGLTTPAYTRYTDAFVENYEQTLQGIQSQLAPHDIETWKKALSELELGIRTSPQHALLQTQLEMTLNKMNRAESELNADCNAPTPAPAAQDPAPSNSNPDSVWNRLSSTQNPEVVGGRRTLAVAYQSCDALALAPMKSSSPELQGLRDIGSHSSGVGRIREYANLATVLASHYYVNGQRPAQASCYDIRQGPLIYSYGGKPYTTVNDQKTLNLFRRAGSGGPTLGIDCSAFVFSALATAGLKMDPDPKRVLKADLVGGINSAAFKEPQSNGLRCLDKITVKSDTSILPGDIIAIVGHVVMVDSIGADPLGLGKITRATDCTAARLPVEDFDFVISQSASVKGAIGINRFESRDYFPTSSTMSQGMQSYAVAACRAKFGLAPQLSSPKLSIVRHRRTPECRSEPLRLANSSCVDVCR